MSLISAFQFIIHKRVSWFLSIRQTHMGQCCQQQHRRRKNFSNSEILRFPRKIQDRLNGRELFSSCFTARRSDDNWTAGRNFIRSLGKITTNSCAVDPRSFLYKTRDIFFPSARRLLEVQEHLWTLLVLQLLRYVARMLRSVEGWMKMFPSTHISSAPPLPLPGFFIAFLFLHTASFEGSEEEAEA